jgi:hypothetical protein
VTGRIEAAFEYDGFGNVIQAWCGTGPNSQFTYGDTANPLLPTEVVEPSQAPWQ